MSRSINISKLEEGFIVKDPETNLEYGATKARMIQKVKALLSITDKKKPLSCVRSCERSRTLKYFLKSRSQKSRPQPKKSLKKKDQWMAPVMTSCLIPAPTIHRKIVSFA